MTQRPEKPVTAEAVELVCDAAEQFRFTLVQRGWSRSAAELDDAIEAIRAAVIGHFDDRRWS